MVLGGRKVVEESGFEWKLKIMVLGFFNIEVVRVHLSNCISRLPEVLLETWVPRISSSGICLYPDQTYIYYTNTRPGLAKLKISKVWCTKPKKSRPNLVLEGQDRNDKDSAFCEKRYA